MRFETTFTRGGWHCDRVKMQKRAEDILHPKFDPAEYDFVCVGSGIRSHLPYNEILNVFVVEARRRSQVFAAHARTRPSPTSPSPCPRALRPGPKRVWPSGTARSNWAAASPRAVVFVTYSGCEFGPKEAEPTLQLLDLEIEHLGFRCVGHFSCPGRFLDHPMPRTYHGDIRDRPNEQDLLAAERFLEERLRRQKRCPRRAPPASGLAAVGCAIAAVRARRDHLRHTRGRTGPGAQCTQRALRRAASPRRRGALLRRRHEDAEGADLERLAEAAVEDAVLDQASHLRGELLVEP